MMPFFHLPFSSRAFDAITPFQSYFSIYYIWETLSSSFFSWPLHKISATYDDYTNIILYITWYDDEILRLTWHCFPSFILSLIRYLFTPFFDIHYLPSRLLHLFIEDICFLLFLAYAAYYYYLRCLFFFAFFISSSLEAHMLSLTYFLFSWLRLMTLLLHDDDTMT